MNEKHKQAWFLAAVLILALGGAAPWFMQAEPAAQDAGLSDATRDKVLKYFRERFAVLDSVHLSLDGLHPADFAPSFDEGTMTLKDATHQVSQPVLVSKDSRYLIMVRGTVIDLTQGTSEEMRQRIQAIYKLPPATKLTVGEFRASPTPDFKMGSLAVDDGKAKQDIPLLLSRDGKHLIVSELFNMNVDPREQALGTISLRDEPTQGPANAPVTIVEYADLECPTCARMQDFLETTLLPRYGNKVRVVFKEYPLPFHDWSLTAAIGCQCAYEINPSTYVPLRTAIFRNQLIINITNVRDTVLSYGEQAGLERAKLAGCLDAKSSLPRIQRDQAEAKRLNVNQTPTLYINGRMMIGLPSEEAYFNLIDGMLAGK